MPRHRSLSVAEQSSTLSTPQYPRSHSLPAPTKQHSNPSPQKPATFTHLKMPQCRRPSISSDTIRILLTLAAVTAIVYLALLLPGGSELTPTRLLFRALSLLLIHMSVSHLDSSLEEDLLHLPADTRREAYRFWKLVSAVYGIGCLKLFEIGGMGKLGDAVFPDLEIRRLGLVEA